MNIYVEIYRMASKVPGVSCRLCGEAGHRPSNCWKELGLPPDGFFSGGGAHRDHGGDEEENVKIQVEKLRNEISTQTSTYRLVGCSYSTRILSAAC